MRPPNEAEKVTDSTAWKNRKFAIDSMKSIQLRGITKQKVEDSIAACKMLLALANEGKVHSPKSGICSNLDDLKCPIDSYDMVGWFSYEWPDRIREDLVFPIKHDCQFFHWQGPNLIQRTSLIKYMIKRLRDLKRRAKT